MSGFDQFEPQAFRFSRHAPLLVNGRITPSPPIGISSAGEGRAGGMKVKVGRNSMVVGGHIRRPAAGRRIRRTAYAPAHTASQRPMRCTSQILSDPPGSSQSSFTEVALDVAGAPWPAHGRPSYWLASGAQTRVSAVLAKSGLPYWWAPARPQARASDAFRLSCVELLRSTVGKYHRQVRRRG